MRRRGNKTQSQGGFLCVKSLRTRESWLPRYPLLDQQTHSLKNKNSTRSAAPKSCRPPPQLGKHSRVIRFVWGVQLSDFLVSCRLRVCECERVRSSCVCVEKRRSVGPSLGKRRDTPLHRGRRMQIFLPSPVLLTLSARLS